MATKLSTLLGSSFTGTTGPAGTIEVGTVTTGAQNSSATVTNSGTERSAILDFSIPRGYSGFSGFSGYSGITPAYPSIGVVVSTGSAWGTSLTAPTGALVGTTDTQTLTNKTLTNPTISGAITFPNGSTQSVAGATTGKAIAMAIVFGG